MSRVITCIVAFAGCGSATPVASVLVPGAAPPRLVAPLSTSRATTRRPTLRWQLPAGARGARVELCADRACARVIDRIETGGGTARPPSALPPGMVYWRATSDGTRWSATWQLWIPRRDTPLDTSRGAISDYDGDGRADAALGFRIFGSPDVGVHRGRADGLAATPDVTLVSPAPTERERFGSVRIPAGDVDGDGYCDLAVASYWPGVVYVFRGGPDGPRKDRPWKLTPRTPSWMVGTPTVTNVLALGDIDGDGYADLATTNGGWVQIFRGGPDGPAETPSQILNEEQGPSRPYFGDAIATPGDLDGDGRADIVLSYSTFGASYVAHLAVFRGGANGLPAEPNATWDIDVPSGQIHELADVGDLDGDGRGDVVVIEDGRAVVHRGTAAGIDPAVAASFAVPAEAAPNAKGGYAWAGAVALGDVDGDGYDDALLVAHWYSKCSDCNDYYGNAGPKRSWLLRGGPGAPTLGRAFVGEPEGMYPEDELNAVGDVDGDGIDDITIDAGNGRIEMYRGGAHGPVDPPRSVVHDPRTHGMWFEGAPRK